jgi:hypothetical protein
MISNATGFLPLQKSVTISSLHLPLISYTILQSLSITITTLLVLPEARFTSAASQRLTERRIMDRSGQQVRATVGGIQPKAPPQLRPPTPARVRRVQQLDKLPAFTPVRWTSDKRPDSEVRDNEAAPTKEEARQSWLKRLRKSLQAARNEKHFDGLS